MKSEIVVIGGGISGCFTALTLANAGYEVTIFDTRPDLLSGSCSVTAGHMNLISHFNDFQMAAQYMRVVIEHQKKHPKFRIGGKFDDQHPLRRGRYFIGKKSLISKEKALGVYRHLQNAYRQLCKEDPANQVFGDPNKFFRILDPCEYEKSVNMKIVDCCIETPEYSLNWPLFKNYLKREVEKYNPQHHEQKKGTIKVLTSTMITDVNYSAKEKSLYELTINKNKKIKFEAKIIVNSAWKDIERITSFLGIPMLPRTNQLKVLAEVGLPRELQDKNHMFFYPHCIFSNMGNGQGLISCIEASDLSYSTKSSLIEKEHLLYCHTRKEKEIYGKKIIKGVAKYIPSMKEAKLHSIRFGIIKSNGIDARNFIYQGTYGHVKVQMLGWIDNASMKLFYGELNARKVLQIIKKQEGLAEKIEESIKNIEKKSQLKLACSKEQALRFYMKRHLLDGIQYEEKELKKFEEDVIKKLYFWEQISGKNHSPCVPSSEDLKAPKGKEKVKMTNAEGFTPQPSVSTPSSSAPSVQQAFYESLKEEMHELNIQIEQLSCYTSITILLLQIQELEKLQQKGDRDNAFQRLFMLNTMLKNLLHTQFQSKGFKEAKKEISKEKKLTDLFWGGVRAVAASRSFEENHNRNTNQQDSGLRQSSSESDLLKKRRR